MNVSRFKVIWAKQLYRFEKYYFINDVNVAVNVPSYT